MLVWVGKKPLSRVQAFPAQLIERFSAAAPASARTRSHASYGETSPKPPKGGEGGPDAPALLFHGDNKEVLGHLLGNGFRGKVQLIYIDPPFDSGADYVRKVSLRGPTGVARIEGESHTLAEQIQYIDIWANDSYLQFIYERLLLLRELLAESGAIYVHCDARRSHQLRLLLDEVFGADSFVSEVVWQSADAQSSAKRYGPIHNTILYYAKSDRRIWNEIRTPLPKSTIDTWYTNEEVALREIVNKLGVLIPKGTVRLFNKSDLTARKRGGDTEYEWKGVRPPIGRYWAYSKKNMEDFESECLLVYSETGRPYLKRYLDEVKGVAPQDVWTDISMIRGISSQESTDYPTEKPTALLQRIIEISSNTNDLVLDCFIGSGTTAAVAQKLGRRWIGCDINKGAIQTTAKRLQTIMREQAREIAETASAHQGAFVGVLDMKSPPAPAQLSFTTWRVNDYDLQIQHNEAVALACEHLGVQRTRTDRFFDGTRGKRLVKIVPFDHPLSPVDLDEVERELEARPEEDRDIELVCLGIELAARAGVEEWNRFRTRGQGGNRLHVIELRSDPAHGGVIDHKPAQAHVEISRLNSQLIIDVKDFISPSIIERLKHQAGVLNPQIDDWRAMVDSVMIDPAYDGTTFNIALSDVPERKTDFVEGRYDLDAPKAQTTVAVKITDMLGEEVLVTKTV